MRIENVVLTETNELMCGRLDAFIGESPEGKMIPAYSLNLVCLGKEMTLDELARCIRSINDFLNDICVAYSIDGEDVIRPNLILRQFEDAFKPETE